MTNYRFEISYDGTRYYGWERQPGKDTIQGKLEAVLSRMTDAEAEIIGAGRTDAGVHAKAMIANAHLDTVLSPGEILAYMNRYLPDDIAVNRVSVVSDRFHARYNAAGKLYTYTCYVGASKPVFNRKYVTVLEDLPDIGAMQKAAAHLVGEHDFKAFCSNPKMKKSTVRTVDSLEITKRKDFLYINVHGDGFLQNMVRIITGTLIEVGEGKRDAQSMNALFEARSRRMAGPTAPAQGLTLMEVRYS